MNEKRIYEIDGMMIEIPIHFDERAKIIIEDYPDFIEAPLWTPRGYRVLFSGTDACYFAQELTSGGCPDCGSCKYFQRAAENTWFGYCKNKNMMKGSMDQ